MTAVLRTEDLSVRFRIPRGLVSAVTEVSFSLQAGRLLALVGESGCGKSVLASALLGLLPANADLAGAAWLRDAQGELELTGAQERVLSRTVRGRRVALVPQSAHAALTPTRTIRSQLEETLNALPDNGFLPIPGHPPDLTALPEGCAYAVRSERHRAACDGSRELRVVGSRSVAWGIGAAC